MEPFGAARVTHAQQLLCIMVSLGAHSGALFCVEGNMILIRALLVGALFCWVPLLRDDLLIIMLQATLPLLLVAWALLHLTFRASRGANGVLDHD